MVESGSASERRYLHGDIKLHVEKSLFLTFAVASKRERYSDLLDSARGRKKVQAALDHFDDLDLSVCRRLEPSEQETSSILRVLKSLGAPAECYIFSSNSEINGRTLNLADALAAVVGLGYGAFISCVPNALAYFEGEGRGERYVCHRR